MKAGVALGVRVASPDVTQRMARGEEVAPDAYFFRTTPRFSVAEGPHGWLRRTVLVGRAVRRPDVAEIEIFAVD